MSGHIKTVNPAFTRLTGFSEEEVLGKQPSLLKIRPPAEGLLPRDVG
ncbi:PAS domain S-box protein [Paenibacillus rhizoplanae]